jgi:hypothetical protein
MRGNFFDLNVDDVAAAQLAVDRQVEQRQVAWPSSDLESCSDGPDLFRLERWLRSGQLPFVPGLRAAKFDLADMLDTHAHSPFDNEQVPTACDVIRVPVYGIQATRSLRS